MTRSALLVLEDGTVFNGTAIGADGCSAGEVVFNTAMTGYQEILSDPSYARQIVTLTYPHIGNVGTTHEDDESTDVFASGLVIRDLPLLASNWRSEKTLQQYLIDNNVVAIADVRISQGHNLPGIRRITENFLIPGHSRIKNHLAHRTSIHTYGYTVKNRPILQYQ